MNSLLRSLFILIVLVISGRLARGAGLANARAETSRCETIFENRAQASRQGRPQIAIDNDTSHLPEPSAQFQPKPAAYAAQLESDPRFLRLFDYGLIVNTFKHPETAQKFADQGIVYLGTSTPTDLGVFDVVRTPKGRLLTLPHGSHSLIGPQIDNWYEGLRENARLDYFFEVAQSRYKNFGILWKRSPPDPGVKRESFLVELPAGYPGGATPSALRRYVREEKLSASKKLKISILDTVLDGYPMPESIEEAKTSVERGKKRMRDEWAEVFSVYSKSVSERRGWGTDVTQALFEKALKKIFHTRLLVIRNHETDEIVAILALQRASYGKVTYFDKMTNSWLERTGPFGATYALDHAAAMDRGRFFDSSQWNKPTPLLGVEQHLGPGLELERPAVIDMVYLPDGQMPKFLNGSPMAHEVDISKPIYFSSGEVVEPAHLFVAEESQLRGIAFGELLHEIIDGLFPKGQSSRFRLQAQRLHTYNDRRGIILDHLWGFKPSANKPKIEKNGVGWTLLSVSASDLLKRFKNPKFLQDRVAREMLRHLEDQLNSVTDREVRLSTDDSPP